MSNPYSNPYSSPPPGAGPNHDSRSSSAASDVAGPAIALMVISGLGLVLGILGLAGDVFLLLSGAIEEMEIRNDGPTSKYTTIAVRFIWGVFLVAVAGFIFYGALQMKNLTNYTVARIAAILAVIPCVGPCCFLGIPFGIWALVVLANPNVRDAFK